MNKFATAVAAILLSTHAGAAAADPLAEWAGFWQGHCTLSPAYQGVSRLEASLTVEPGASGRYAWRLVYEANGPMARSVRNYELVPVDAARGHYVLDEKNGLLLDAFLAARALHFYFAIGGTRIPALYVMQDVLLTGREIVASLPAFAQSPVRNSCAGSQCADSYRLNATQICRLQRR